MPFSTDPMSRFDSLYGRKPEFLTNAPSRINLIGEHIDYCGGHVLPMAIRGGTTIHGAGNHSSTVNVYTERFGERVSLEVRPDHSPGYYGDWRDYAAGVISLLAVDQKLQGCDLYVTQSAGTAGLSTSASFCLALARSLESQLDAVTLAQICQRVEHEFAGVQCGIMDQMSIAIGGIIFLDCQRLQWQKAIADLSDVVIVVMDTARERTLAASAYNDRVNELRQVAEVSGLRDIDSLVSVEASDHLPDYLRGRHRHITTEERRVNEAFEVIQAADWSALGNLMIESHASLRDDYEVSCAELDIMVDLACRQEGVMGARMTGGGFGGCAIALAEKASVSDWMPRVAQEYEEQTGLVPHLFVAELAEGLTREGC